MPKGVYDRKKRPLAERFWEKVQKTDACWLWTAAATKGYKDGRFRYGVIGVGRAMKRAHRISWELHNGPVPDGLFVCHHCDTPLCVRPDHLFLGTASDNMIDCVEKGRHESHLDEAHAVVAARTSCKNGHPYDERNTYRGRAGTRSCRICMRTRQRRWELKKGA